MEFYDVIFKRKSIRHYKETPLDDARLEEILQYSRALTPLFPEIKTSFGIIKNESVNGLFAIDAPQYLAFYSEEKESHYLNAGFLMQQMDLYLSATGLGACWLGMAKPRMKEKDGLAFIMMFAFGEPNQTLHRKDVSEFKRKPLAEVAEGGDGRLEAAWLAPSAANAQPWFFSCSDGAVDVFRVKLNPVKAAVFDRLNLIDSGIALCHLKVATEHMGKPFSFAQTPEKSKKGYQYIGTVLS
ncbi:MAG: nitroreductase [Oscillospiraceae bacterium]|jgi:nitroreductase|nr:nitroreductase [Oscillospiraceae bacterium]